MGNPVKPNSGLQTHQLFLYSRAIHPALLPIKSRHALKHGNYEVEISILDGGHVLRFESGTLCCCELLTAQEIKLPEQGLVSGFLAVGERDFEHRFIKDKVVYMNTIQSETLSESLFLATYDEMIDYASTTEALVHKWNDEAGRCLSIIDSQRFNQEVHVQCHHLVAREGLVIRTQTIFETAESPLDLGEAVREPAVFPGPPVVPATTVLPVVTVMWDPALVSPAEYASVIRALGNLTAAEGGQGLSRMVQSNRQRRSEGGAS